MTQQTKILLLITAFVVFMVASFVWFVATWDPSQEPSVTSLSPVSQDSLT